MTLLLLALTPALLFASVVSFTLAYIGHEAGDLRGRGVALGFGVGFGLAAVVVAGLSVWRLVGA